MKVGVLPRLLIPTIVAVLASAGCSRVPRSSGPLPRQVYIWQRVWNPQVESAIAEARDGVDGFAVLVAEIDLRPRTPKIDRPDVNFAALQAAGRPVALALRIDPFAGPFSSKDANAQLILRIIRESMNQARERRLEPSELQIDFDCGDAKLDGYRTWLREIRGAVAPLPVTPTMLPSWLKRREFAVLARESGGFILQVHSVGTPQTLSAMGSLTEPARAQQWVNEAAKIGVPFRVSLPTYSYLIAFEEAGKFIGLSAEGLSTRWPAGSQLVRWEAQPAEMAALVNGWTRRRPTMLQGVCWYRLPVASDSLNWGWKTLAAVMNGRAPQSALRVSASESQPSEIVLINEGEMDEPLPPTIEARWENATLVAADALEGYSLTRTDDRAAAVFTRNNAGAVFRLRPGARRSVGWLRCEPQTPAQLSLSVAVAAAPRSASDAGARDGH